MEQKELTIDDSEALETLAKIKAEVKEIAELKGQVSERQDFSKVAEIVEVDSLDKANELLGNGLVLIDTYYSHGFLKYVLGRITLHSDLE